MPFQKRYLNNGASRVLKWNWSTHFVFSHCALREHKGDHEALRGHWSKIWVKPKCYCYEKFSQNYMLLWVCWENSYLIHLCRFMDNVVLTYLKVQNIFSYLLIQCTLTSPSSKDCKRNFHELHFVPTGRTFGDVLYSSQAICSRLLHGCSEKRLDLGFYKLCIILDSKGPAAPVCLTWHSSAVLRMEIWHRHQN